ncbi:hypothetical protein FOL46_004317, partial [Perkinsus olseni]
MSTPSDKEVRDLFDRMTALSNKHGWLDLIDHYSTQCRDEKVVNFIRSFFVERRGWSNTAMIDPYAFSKVRMDESCLPLAVTQLRAQGLDGSKESTKVGTKVEDLEVVTSLVDPAIVGTIIVMVGNYNMTAVKATRLFVKATLGISVGQCYVCSPPIIIGRDGTQIASAELEDTKVHGNSAAHREELDGLVNWAKSFYGLLQSSIE